ncbi:MAG: IPExxxVDY family protein [Bacteroidota bacterium]
MKRKKLVIDYEYDFDLMGIVSSVKDYKLAWALNNFLSIELEKADDHILKFNKVGDIKFSNYIFATEHSEIRLFKNKAVDVSEQSKQFLVPEMGRFDYFLTAKGIISNCETKELADRLKRMRFIEYIVNINIETIKSKDNFLV